MQGGINQRPFFVLNSTSFHAHSQHFSTSNKHDLAHITKWSHALKSPILALPFFILRLDRSRHSGGVALYIHNSVLYNVLLCGPAGLELIVVSLSRIILSCVWVCFKYPHSLHLLFLTCCVILYLSTYVNPIFLILVTLMLTFTSIYQRCRAKFI